MTSMAPSSPARNASFGRALRMVAFALIGGLLCAAASAKQSDRSQDVKVRGISVDVKFQAKGVSHIRNAVITQGTLEARGDLATVHLDDQSAVKRVVLTGHAHIQQLDDNGNLMTGEAGSIDYDVQDGIAILTGDAHVKQAGRGSASGDKLTYDTKTSMMTGQGSSGQGVVLTFKARQPSSGDQPATGASAAKPATAASTPAAAKQGN